MTLCRNYCFPHFADEQTEVQQWSNLLKITQLIGGKAGMQTQVVWLQSLHSYPLSYTWELTWNLSLEGWCFKLEMAPNAYLI